MRRGRCVCGCGARGRQQHHVVTRQELRRLARALGRSYAQLARDPRNLVWITNGCHAGHHAACPRLRLHMLPDSVFEFAVEVMGAGPAYAYLGRYYMGSDVRHERLVEGPGTVRAHEAADSR